MSTKGKRLKPIYGNCKVLHPKGHMMFLCLEKRARWYLDRDLATVVSEDPLTIQLTFEPKGSGNTEEYYLSDKPNACVVCGKTDLEILTKHHVIPIEYRKHFPVEKKSRSSHDIVVICTDHHYEYENNYAQKLKRKIEDELGISRTKLSMDKNRSYKAYNFTGIMLDPERIKKIPPARIDFFRKELMELFGTDDPFEVSQLNISRKIDSENEEIGRLVVERIGNIDEFAIMWRKHFVESMNPKFLPSGWKIDHKVETHVND